MAKKASESMDSDVGSAEDVVQAFLEYLVDPLLPSKSSARENPSLSQQQLVSKQVHAVVLLYNYYQRRKHAEVEFLNFESFCKLAVTLRPSLMSHMKILNRSDYTELNDLENQFSLTEKAIMDACDLSLVLNASKDVPSTEGWPISKVAVLLIDSRKENCVLVFSSITHGVWSVIEKDLDVSNASSEDAVEGKNINKRKRIARKPLRDEANAGEAGFQQLAYSAVKEAMGINQTDLMVLESHVVYSTSKEKTASQFYLVQCTKSINEDLQVPIKDVIDSLQGPLVKKSSCSWTVTPVVEYFHVLPYARIISGWLSREMFSSSVQDLRLGLGDVNANSSQKTENSCDKEVVANGDNSNKHCGVADSIERETNGANAESPKLKSNDSLGGPHGMDVEDSSTDGPQKEDRKKKFGNAIKVYHHQKRATSSVENSMNSSTSGIKVKVEMVDSMTKPCVNECKDEKVDAGNKICSVIPSDQGVPIGEHVLVAFQLDSKSLEKVEMVDSMMEPCVNECRDKKVDTGNKICSVIPSDQGVPIGDHAPVPFQLDSKSLEKVEVVDSMMKPCVNECRDEKVDAGNKICSVIPSDQGVPIGDHALVPFQLDSKYLEKVQVTLASKENELSQTALRVLLRKRDKLSRHLRNLEDEIAVCDKNIQTILDGGADDMALKIEAIIDGCNEVCLKSERQTRDSTNQHFEDQGSPQNLKRKRLAEAILTLRNPCQELDDICYENNWILPTYCVTPSDDGFLANVTVKGMDFECSGGSSLRSNPREARESAAAQMIGKLQDMAGKMQ
ncbi:uncharacterized protein LOC132275422 isoform X2 [Cornus florida]|uniref:uncharacterized protein LOC132275422 isoform X2 n=1 Tax=Cornus florida TaxID=4283 RepID=UPI00289846D6|nr:uncharacterized protein LOC132275422 isoform X2 [Cornus florida]